MSETLEGTLLTVRYQNPETDRVSVDVLCADEKVIRAVGTLPNPAAGEKLRLNGAYTRHRGIGRVFDFQSYRVRPPEGLDAQIKYLERTLAIEGGMAEVLIKRFGEDTLAVLETAPEKLVGLADLDSETVNTLQQRYLGHKSADRLTPLMEELGLDPAILIDLRRHLGQDQVNDAARENPYLLTLHSRVRFIKADRLAQRLQALQHPDRLLAAIVDVLRHHAAQGHTYLALAELPGRLTPLTSSHLTLEDPRMTEALRQLRDRDLVVRTDDHLYLHKLFEYETDIALGFQRLQYTDRQYDAVINRSWFTQHLHRERNLRLNDELEQYLDDLMLQKCLLVPVAHEGRARDMLVIAQELYDQLNAETVFVTPGRGDHVLLKRWLGESTFVVSPGQAVGAQSVGPPRHRKDHPLEIDTLVVYRAELLTCLEMASLINALPAYAQLVLIGDPHGILPYGPGQPFLDLLEQPIARCELPPAPSPAHNDPASLSHLKTALREQRAPALPQTPKRQNSVWFIPANAEQVCGTLRTLFEDFLPTISRQGTRDAVVFGVAPPPVLEQWNGELQSTLNATAPTPLGAIQLAEGDPIYLQSRLADADIPAGTRYEVRALINGPKVALRRMASRDDDLVLESSHLRLARLGYVQRLFAHPGQRFDTVVLVAAPPYDKDLTRQVFYQCARLARKRLILIGDREGFIRAVQHNVDPRDTGLALAFARHAPQARSAAPETATEHSG